MSMPSADLLLCFKKKKGKEKKREEKPTVCLKKLSFIYRKDSSTVGTTPTPTDVVQVFSLEAPN